MPSGNVMRPKSSAAVVSTLSGVRVEMSTPAATSVIAASVDNGSISEIAPTVVVLPTPKPPATTTLSAMGAGVRSEATDTLQQSFEHADPFVELAARGGADRQHALGGEVADEHAHDTEVQPQERGDLHDRVRLLAELDDGAQLGRGADGERHSLGDDDRLEGQIGLTARASAGEDVRPGQRRSGRLVGHDAAPIMRGVPGGGR